MNRAFVVSALQSGAGKTTLTLALLSAFRKRGSKVQSFKVGPDFIDPGLLGTITGSISYNLDRFLTSDDYILSLFFEKAKGADIVVVEGVMGLLDGGRASTYETARLLGIPIVVVIDAKALAETVAVLAKGVESICREVSVAGVIANRVSSSKHERLLRRAIEEHTDLPFLGALPYREDISIPERHLGLYQAEDGVIREETIETLAGIVEENIEIQRLLDIENTRRFSREFSFSIPKTGVNISVARDRAFSFYYSDCLEILSKGARLRYFSPIRDKAIPEDTDFLYLGGGYPELYAEELSQNRDMLDSIRQYILSGGKTYAECGGFIYLTKGIYDLEKRFYPLVGVFDTTSYMNKRLVRLGYREIQLLEDTPIGYKGLTLRGHEFHYSDIERQPTRNVYASVRGAEGYLFRNCLGSYVHLHLASNPESFHWIFNG